MKHLSLRPFRAKDIDFAYEMNVSEQWGDTRSDIERLFSYEPDGCFIAEVNGESVGHVFSVSYGNLGWIGMLIVKMECRKNGVGTTLTKKAMDYLLKRGVETIKLEAVPEIAGLYRKLGFEDEYDSLRFSGNSQNFTVTPNSDMKMLKKDLIKKVARFDAEYFGANRLKVLTQLHNDYPKLCFGAYEGSELVGYIMCRRTQNGFRIGPWVCNPNNPQVARELLMTCVGKLGKNVNLYVGVPAKNKSAVEVLQEFDFEQYSKSIRMRFGKQLENERVNGVFAIGGPEKG